MKGNLLKTLLFVGFTSNTFAAQEFKIELGLGVDYGGIGTQFHFPIDIKNTDIYLATGLFYASTDSNEEIGVGAGVNYYINPQGAVTFYYGTMNVDKYLTNNLEVETESDYGVSIGYKYYFNRPSKPGFSLGLNYNVYDDDSYPFVSLGYRF